MKIQQRIKEVDAYIDKYYIPGDEDIEGEEVENFFDKITEFLKTKKEVKQPDTESTEKDEEVLEEIYAPSFDISKAKKQTVTHPMSEVMITGRRLDDLMSQMDETFSQRLLRMIKERDMSEAEAYKRAYVDRRHFSKIKKDEYYMPNKKTVLAFCIALELTLDEAKDLLRSAGYALSRSSKVDIVIVYFIEKKIYNLNEINDVLFEYDLPVFE